MATSKKTKKVIRVYTGICTAAVTVWAIVVIYKVAISALVFVGHTVQTIVHSIPVLG